jgi:annexin A7/11
MQTEKLFEYVLSASRVEESVPMNYVEIEDKVDRLYNATEGHQFEHVADAVCQVIAFSSDAQLRAIDVRYAKKYRHDLDHIIKHNFSGHMESALRLMLGRAVDRAKSDADGLEHAMKVIGTYDHLLIERMVRTYTMGREHMRQVCSVHQKWYDKSLSERIHVETSGHYRDIMIALCI